MRCFRSSLVPIVAVLIGAATGCSTEEPDCDADRSKVRNCGRAFATWICADPVGRCVVSCWAKLTCAEFSALEAGESIPQLSRCLSHCEERFHCEDGSDIPGWWQCDTFRDCADGSDEPSDCRYFQCDDGSAARQGAGCDDYLDCADGSDELDCEEDE
jgi:hypothetical protein